MACDHAPVYYLSVAAHSLAFKSKITMKYVKLILKIVSDSNCYLLSQI